MPARKSKPAPTSESEFFAKELAGETPPSFATMHKLYNFASQLFEQRPWLKMNENNLVLFRDPATGETCYCSVMGQLGEVLALHAYIGTEGYRIFRRIENDQITPGEFFTSQHCVYVDFVPMEEMEVQDRKLLKAFGHPRSAEVGPQFRTIRPGYRPWFVTEPEAQTLIGCISAVFVICSVISKEGSLSYWEQENLYPLVSATEVIREEGGIVKQNYRVDPVEMSLPPEQSAVPAMIDEEQLQRLRKNDYRMGGALELDHFLSDMVVGKKNERKMCVCMAMAADSQSGFLFPPEIADPGTSAPEALAKALINALESFRGLPQEVRVQTSHFKNYIQPIADICGFSVKVVKSLPALKEARAAMKRMLGRSGSIS
ncbi:MAG TPA: hypothetical protein VG759_20600 [Candidatus Angelobacter sp.]|jgi:hypothetical protein|nr:hypothetical protein [Candidatus Angelobacter sp.]